MPDEAEAKGLLALCLLTESRRLAFFSFNDTPTTQIYTLSLHDALPIFRFLERSFQALMLNFNWWVNRKDPTDRKSTRLNSSHSQISYAVFCLKKKTRTCAKKRFVSRGSSSS